MPIKPRKPLPALEFDTLAGGRWSLAAQKPQHFNEIVQSLDFVISKDYPARGEA